MNIISVCTFRRTDKDKLERGIIIVNNVTADQLVIDGKCKVVDKYVSIEYASANGCFTAHLIDNETVNIKPLNPPRKRNYSSTTESESE